MFKRFQAEALNSEAMKLQDRGELIEAIAVFEKAIAAAPKWSAPLYNLGLLYKRQRKWADSLEYNQRATELDRDNEGAWWNLGIAATALGRWDVARAAWRAFGIDIPASDGPVDFYCGFGPIRLNPDGEGEIVWAHRIDPARARLASIPFPESGHRCGDLVLNDGAPVGYRQYKGQEVPVLDALALLEKSPLGTFVARVALPPGQEQVVRLAELAAEMEGSAEDWSTSVRLLCKACSEGRPHETHDAEAAPVDGVHFIGIAARNVEHATEILSAWETGGSEIDVQSLDEAL